jgi:hypothetical protein
MRSNAEQVDAAGGDLHHDQYVLPSEQDRVDMKKSIANKPVAWPRRNVRQVVSTVRGAGPIRQAARMRRIVPAPTS